MASTLLPPAVAAEQLRILNESAPQEATHSQTIQLFFLVSIFGLWSLAYFGMTALSVRRSLQGKQKLWLFRRLDRHSAIYIIPNGGFIFMITGCFAWASRVIGLAVNINSYHYGNSPTWVGFAAMYCAPIIFIIGAWLSICSQIFVVSMTFGGRVNEQRMMLPPPWVMHLLCYGLLVAWTIANIPIASLLTKHTSDSFRAVDTVRQFLLQAVNGTFEDSSIPELIQAGQAAQSSGTNTQHFLHIFIALNVSFGAWAIVFYMPFFALFIHKLGGSLYSMRKLRNQNMKLDTIPATSTPVPVLTTSTTQPKHSISTFSRRTKTTFTSAKASSPLRQYKWLMLYSVGMLSFAFISIGNGVSLLIQGSATQNPLTLTLRDNWIFGVTATLIGGAQLALILKEPDSAEKDTTAEKGQSITRRSRSFNNLSRISEINITVEREVKSDSEDIEAATNSSEEELAVHK